MAAASKRMSCRLIIMSKYIDVPTITFGGRTDIIKVAIDEGANGGVKAVVTVNPDPSLLPVAFGKADGATPHSVETSPPQGEHRGIHPQGHRMDEAGLRCRGASGDEYAAAPTSWAGLRCS